MLSSSKNSPAASPQWLTEQFRSVLTSTVVRGPEELIGDGECRWRPQSDNAERYRCEQCSTERSPRSDHPSSEHRGPSQADVWTSFAEVALRSQPDEGRSQGAARGSA